MKLVESRLCEQKYDHIDYEKVPGVAMNKYKKAFQRNDPIRFSEYLHDLVRRTKRDGNEMLEIIH